MSRSSGALESFLEQVVVDEYAEVPDASRGADVAGRRRPHLLAALVLLVIGVLISAAVISTRQTEAVRQETKAALAERVAERTAAVESVQGEVEDSRAAVDALRDRLLDDAALSATMTRVDALDVTAAGTPLAGPGLTVTVDDAPDAEAGSLNRVLDRDLQDIVNALWQMQAQGIAVNDIRLTATTAIRGAGDAILVDYRPLTRPYVVTAVGTATTDEQVSPVQALLDGLAADYGLVGSVSTGDVALPAGEIRSPRFATVTTPAEEDQPS